MLDQPEDDDLENSSIRHPAVETLRDIISRRQLIVSTHNANVGDTAAAENMFVLQHGDLDPGIEAEGALQGPGGKVSVCEIFEGAE